MSAEPPDERDEMICTAFVRGMEMVAEMLREQAARPDLADMTASEAVRMCASITVGTAAAVRANNGLSPRKPSDATRKSEERML